MNQSIQLGRASRSGGPCAEGGWVLLYGANIHPLSFNGEGYSDMLFAGGSLYHLRPADGKEEQALFVFVPRPLIPFVSVCFDSCGAPALA